MADIKLIALPVITSSVVTDYYPLESDQGGGLFATSRITLANLAVSVVAAFGSSGTGNLARVTSPVFVTPSLGVAAATSVAVGGAAIGGDALAVAGTSSFSSNVTIANSQAYRGLSTGAVARQLISMSNGNNVVIAGDGDPIVLTGRVSNTASPSASQSAQVFTGTVFTGGTGTTTLPFSLIQPIGATAATTWSTAGTLFGINAPSGFTGKLIDIRVNGGSSTFFALDASTQLASFSGSVSATNIIPAPTGIIQFGGGGQRAVIASPADGIIALYNNGQTDFTRLQFGGTTASFPAIKRNGTAINFRLADDSADAGITAAGITASGNVNVATGYVATQAVRDATATTKIDLTSNGFVDFVAGQVVRINGASVSGGMTTPSLVVKASSSTSDAMCWQNSSGADVGNLAVDSSGNGLLQVKDSGATARVALGVSGGVAQITLTNSTSNAFITTPAAATIQFGSVDTSVTTAQTLRVQSAIAGNANIAGADWTMVASLSTGTGVAGNQILQAGFQGTSATSVVTITNNAPATVNWTAHGLVPGSSIQFTTTGTLPTGLALLTTYYVIAAGLTTDNFRVAATPGGTAITTSSGSGTHTATTQATVQNPASTIATWGPSALTGSQTTNVLTINQTINTTGLTRGVLWTFPTLNIAAGSDYFRIQGGVAGTTQIFNVSKDGDARASTSFGLAAGGNGQWNINSLNLINTSGLGWVAGANATAALDVILTRGGVATLQHGAADAAAPIAQTIGFQNVVAGTLDTAGVATTIRNSRGTGAGLGGNIVFQYSPHGSTGTAQNAWATALTINGDTAAVTAVGNLQAANFTSVASITAGATGLLLWNGRSGVQSPADGVIELSNNAQTDFSRLQFGGTTASFPSLKRSTTAIAARLADDSDDAPLTCLYVKTKVLTVSTLPAAATAGAGASAYVSDANATTFHATVAGGGANNIRVVSDGTNWKIGG